MVDGLIRTELVPGEVVAVGVSLGLNVAGVVIPASWPAGYIPTVGDPVRVLMSDGRASVLGPVITTPRPGDGTVAGAASGGTVPVDTVAGQVRARYAGTAPTSGQLVLLDWQATFPRIIGGAAAAVTPPADPGAPPQPPAPPAQVSTGTTEAGAVGSSTWGSASGWDRYGDEVRQWRYGSEAESRGAWFYGAGLAALRGATVLSAAIYLPARLRIGSYNAAATLHLARHTSDSRPTGDVTRTGTTFDVPLPAGWGGGWCDVPAGFMQALVDSGGGVAISGAPYAGVVGLSGSPLSGQLRASWRRA